MAHITSGMDISEISQLLPQRLPVFPLTGVVLLPDGRLPLNVFEKRYLAMVDDALAGSRLIGMIQPLHPAITHEMIDGPVVATSRTTAQSENPLLYRTGCAGRIVGFEETDDGRYQIELRGVCRFDIGSEESLAPGGYRIVKPVWDRFTHDLTQKGPRSAPGRQKLVTTLRHYFVLHGLSADWDVIDSTPDDKLLTTLAMVCPFAPREKQALLEADSLPDLADIMQTLIDMALLTGNGWGNQNIRH